MPDTVFYVSEHFAEVLCGRLCCLTATCLSLNGVNFVA